MTMPNKADDERRVSVDLETVGRLLGVAVPFLPALGFGVRWASFALTESIGPSLPIAAATPFSALLASGVVYGLAAATVGAFVFLLILLDRPLTRFVRAPLRMQGSEKRGERWLGRSYRPLLRAILLVSLVAAVVLPNGIIYWIALATAVPSVFLVEWGKRFQSWTAYVPAVAMGSLSIILTASLLRHVFGVGVGEFTLRANAVLPGGRYIELGRSGDTTYLYPCDASNEGAYAIPSSQIVEVHYDSDALEYSRTSLLDAIRGKGSIQLGLPLTCKVVQTGSPANAQAPGP